MKFFFFYDFLNDGFVDLALKFYEDPFGFDLDEARAEVNDDEENQPDQPIPPCDIVTGKSPYDITLPNADLDARVEESFRTNPLLKGKDINVMKQQAYCLV